MRSGTTGNRWIAAVAIGLFAALAACQPAGRGPVAPSPEEAPEEEESLAPAQVREAARGAVEQYRQAYEVLTFDGLAPLYVHGPEVEVISQGQRYSGWEEVESYLRDLLERANRVRVRVGDLRVIALGPTGAIATAEIDRNIRGPVTSVSAQGVLSLTFRRDDGRWLIVSEHLSFTTSPD